MKKLVILIIGIAFIITGCGDTNGHNSTLDIDDVNESKILNYLDTKTNDISSPSKGKLYSSYKILGYDKNKLYLWIVKEEYILKDNNVEYIGNGVGCPVVLYITNDNNEFLIEKHDSPEDGVNYGADIKRLFPEKIIDGIGNLNEDDKLQLKEAIKKRVHQEN